MCKICVEYNKGSMTAKEAARAYIETTSTEDTHTDTAVHPEKQAELSNALTEILDELIRNWVKKEKS